mgnify:CR=1 FL=1
MKKQLSNQINYWLAQVFNLPLNRTSWTWVEWKSGKLQIAVRVDNEDGTTYHYLMDVNNDSSKGGLLQLVHTPEEMNVDLHL